MIYNRRTLRLCIRLGCLVLAILLVYPVSFWINHSKTVAQASPFVTLCTLLAGGALVAGSLIGLGISIIAVFRKRWFCRYICPTGLLLDGASGIGLARTSWWKRCPSIGKNIVLITAAGAVVGYPLLMWMDPLVFFNSAFSVYASTGILSGILSVAGIVILLLIALTSGSLWCARICPLGASQDILSNVWEFLKKTKKQKSNTEPGHQDTIYVTRRMVLAIVSGLGVSLYAKRIGIVQAQEILRPPGAVRDHEFSGRCVRCGNCMRACPSKIIYPDIGQTGVLGFMSPFVSYKNGYCIETCNDCTEVCPSGALKKLTLEEKNRYNIGKAFLNSSLCYMVRGVNDCDICVRSCPYDAIQIYWDEDAYVAFPFVDTAKCNGCGACERFCPTGDIRAITVKNDNLLIFH